MRDKLDAKRPPSQAAIFQIRIKGHLQGRWVDSFEGFAISLEEEGETLLSGPVVDQAALYGLLKKVRDLGMALVSVAEVRSNTSSHQSQGVEKHREA